MCALKMLILAKVSVAVFGKLAPRSDCGGSARECRPSITNAGSRKHTNWHIVSAASADAGHVLPAGSVFLLSRKMISGELRSTTFVDVHQIMGIHDSQFSPHLSTQISGARRDGTSAYRR